MRRWNALSSGDCQRKEKKKKRSKEEKKKRRKEIYFRVREGWVVVKCRATKKRQKKTKTYHVKVLQKL